MKSTYFVLLTSDFYNVFSKDSCDGLKRIQDAGHEIGLHFDEVRYSGISVDGVKEKISEECEVFSHAIGMPITTVSMHRPSKQILDANLCIPGVVNSYGKVFFQDFKYLSDSRRHWREPVSEIIQSREFNRLHILTHAFWYNEEERDLRTSLIDFINTGNISRYGIMHENFSRLEDELTCDEIVGGRL